MDSLLRMHIGSIDLDLPSIALTALPTLALLAVILIGGAMLIHWPSERYTVAVCRSIGLCTLISAVVLAVSVFSDATGRNSVSLQLGEWFFLGEHDLNIVFFGDRLSSAFAILISVAYTFAGHFSVRYLHREPGHARFFLLMSLFSLGMITLALAGNLAVLFVGWELVGLTSALLIGFFHDRSSPVIAGIQAFATYRICDIGLLTGAFLLAHYAPKEDLIAWSQHGSAAAIVAALPPEITLATALLLLLAAMGKSAQFPVGGWLPKAMEGPTPTSAVFYGSLSVHAGVYLLLRAYPLFEAVPAARYTMLVVGLATAVYGALVRHVQSDAKNILAYATMAQLGLIFAEISCGFTTLATWHFFGHGALRMWQFLRVPSAIHELHALSSMLGGRRRLWHIWETILPTRASLWLYTACVERFYLEQIIEALVIRPFQALVRLVVYIDGYLYGEHAVSALTKSHSIAEANLMNRAKGLQPVTSSASKGEGSPKEHT